MLIDFITFIYLTHLFILKYLNEIKANEAFSVNYRGFMFSHQSAEKKQIKLTALVTHKADYVLDFEYFETLWRDRFKSRGL